METRQGQRYRFGVFEVDPRSGELRRQGLRIRLSPQPFQVLCLLLQRPGEVLTREEICRELWPDDTFVDYEHGVNAAVNRLREVLRDRAGAPRYVETLPRRGYRFVGPVEVLGAEMIGSEANTAATVDVGDPENLPGPSGGLGPVAARSGPIGVRWLASAEDLPKASEGLVRSLWVLLQAMYLAFYVCALANLGEIGDLLSALPQQTLLFWLVGVSAGMLIPVRVYLLCAALFRPPGMRARFLWLWPVLLGSDLLWAVSPFLMLDHFSFGLALACIAPLVYAPFAQRSLVLMGALESPGEAS